MVIRQGDIYWIDLEDSIGSEPGYRRPVVIIQNNIFNQSRMSTVIGCVLSSNIRLADLPGNVLLEPGEGGLPKQSVVTVSEVVTWDKRFLGDYSGSLSNGRIFQILEGLQLLLNPGDVEMKME